MEKDVEEYELVDIKYDFPRATRHVTKAVSRQRRVVNLNEHAVTRTSTVSMSTEESSSWNHGIQGGGSIGFEISGKNSDQNWDHYFEPT